MFAVARGACRIVLGSPPSVAWPWEVFPWFLSGTCWLTIVGLWCLGVPWSCGGPVFMVRSTVSGRDCVFLSPRSSRSLSLLWLGLGSWPSCGVTSLRLALCSSACDGSGGCPSFWQVGSAPLLWVPLLRAGCVWGFHPFASPASSFGMWSPFGSRVSLSLLIANEGLHWWFFLSDVATPLWGSSRRLTSSFGLSALLVAGGRAVIWLVTGL